MSQRNAPAGCRPRRQALQGTKRWVVIVDPPSPDRDVRQLDEPPAGVIDQHDRGAPGSDVVVAIDRPGADVVVVPWQDDHRPAEPSKLSRGPGHSFAGNAGGVEEVACDHKQVDPFPEPKVDQPLESGFLGPRPITTSEVAVRCVQDPDLRDLALLCVLPGVFGVALSHLARADPTLDHLTN
jgi:hypothetical protein